MCNQSRMSAGSKRKSTVNIDSTSSKRVHCDGNDIEINPDEIKVESEIAFRLTTPAKISKKKKPASAAAANEAADPCTFDIAMATVKSQNAMQRKFQKPLPFRVPKFKPAGLDDIQNQQPQGSVTFPKFDLNERSTTVLDLTCTLISHIANQQHIDIAICKTFVRFDAKLKKEVPIRIVDREFSDQIRFCLVDTGDKNSLCDQFLSIFELLLNGHVSPQFQKWCNQHSKSSNFFDRKLARRALEHDVVRNAILAIQGHEKVISSDLETMEQFALSPPHEILFDDESSKLYSCRHRCAGPYIVVKLCTDYPLVLQILQSSNLQVFTWIDRIRKLIALRQSVANAKRDYENGVAEQMRNESLKLYTINAQTQAENEKTLAARLKHAVTASKQKEQLDKKLTNMNRSHAVASVLAHA